ncbi:hypothetical protein NIIDNTM18_28050 [Mycolicibacterium litorale]|uniref:Uncharacterized protein n=1 Tax=Mycolicibacterium litorale TaxID=758802 RepID=A0A6S6P7U4_9MYCO|nr:hypothetical protein NIIDNTM18_28050 [Mycolicibacterium litorale]
MAVRRRLGRGARITVGENRPLSGAELLRALGDVRCDKLIAAGRHVVAAIDSPTGEHGVVIADVENRPFAITRVRLFPSLGLTRSDRG